MLRDWHQLQTGMCHLPLQGLNHVLLQLLTFKLPTPPTEGGAGQRAGMRRSVLWKNGQTSPSDDYFQELIF